MYDARRPPHAWEKSYPPGIRWDSPIATSTLQELLDGAVADYGERSALEYRDRRLSYRELGNQAARAAAAVGISGSVAAARSRSICRTRLGIRSRSLACFGPALHVVHLSPLDAERELIHKLPDSGVRTLVTCQLVRPA